jgi:hypothetical protein
VALWKCRTWNSLIWNFIFFPKHFVVCDHLWHYDYVGLQIVLFENLWTFFSKKSLLFVNYENVGFETIPFRKLEFFSKKFVVYDHVWLETIPFRKLEFFSKKFVVYDHVWLETIPFGKPFFFLESLLFVTICVERNFVWCLFMEPWQVKMKRSMWWWKHGSST